VPQANSLHRVVRFGAFEADLRSGELRKDGTRIRLQEQPFQILQALLERPGEIVTREELRLKLWPADTYVDFDHGLNNAIKRLREGLNDSAENPKFIETLSRRGYRFIGPHDISPSSAAPQDSIAVLPFTNLSADPENEFFADGITEEIINALAQIEHLHVAARSSAFSFKGKYVDLRVIGEQLNVRTVLEGSVRRAGNRIRITAQLVNVTDACHLWSERYDREIKDIFEIQDEIARSIASRLKVTLEGVPRALVRPGTKNLEAYSPYVKGRALLYRRSALLPVAVEWFKKAVALDPEYALAWAGIADAYTVLAMYGFIHPETSRPKWQEAARRAVAADSSLAEAHCALAFGKLLFDWEKTTAEREFLSALELNPSYIQARDWYAVFYLQLAAGRLADGIAHAKLALESDPLSCYVNTMLSFAYLLAGEYAGAVRSAKRAVELDSESFLAWGALHLGLQLSGRFEEAVAAGQTAMAMAGRHPIATATVAVSLADSGKPAEAEAVYQELLARARREYVQPSMLAFAADAAARQDEAIQHVRQALAIGDASRCFLSSYWPLSPRLRRDSRIDRMLKENGIE
jgi:TolB-like protein